MMRRIAVIGQCTVILSSLVASTVSAAIQVEESAFIAFGAESPTSNSSGPAVNQSSYTLPGFDVGAGMKLVVAVTNESGTEADFGVTFGGSALTQIVIAQNLGGIEYSHLYFLDGASGSGDIVVSLGTAPLANGAGIFAVSLSGAAAGVESSGAFGTTAFVSGDLTGVLTGVGDGSYVLAAFSDNENKRNSGVIPDVQVSGDLSEVLDGVGGIFNGDFGNETGSAIGTVASGFGDGTDLTATFSDVHAGFGLNLGYARSNFAYASFSEVPEASGMLVWAILVLSTGLNRRRWKRCPEPRTR